MKRHHIAVGLACLLGLACTMSTEPQPDLLADGHFTTDASGYTAQRFEGAGQLSRYRFTVITRFQNNTSAPLYLGRCFPNTPKPIFSALLADRSKESAYAQISACVGHDQQFEIAPGAMRIDTLQVDGPNAFDGRTGAPFGVTEGAFRMDFDVRLTRGDGAPPAPESVRFSNAFVVRTG